MDLICAQANVVFEYQFDANFSFTSYKNKMFFIWDGNYKYIDHVQTKKNDLHVFMDSIILAPRRDDILSLLIGLHNSNRSWSSPLVSLILFYVIS